MILRIAEILIPVKDDDHSTEVIEKLIAFLDTISPDKELNFDYEIDEGD